MLDYSYFKKVIGEFIHEARSVKASQKSVFKLLSGKHQGAR